MARDRGKQKEPDDEDLFDTEEIASTRALKPMQDLARRAIGIGLSGFFLTEETIRKAVGDTLPKDWSDFAVGQSERTRQEFLERLSFELAQTIEKIDMASVMAELLEGRTLEVKAEIRLGKKPTRINASIRDDEEKT